MAHGVNREAKDPPCQVTQRWCSDGGESGCGGAGGGGDWLMDYHVYSSVPLILHGFKVIQFIYYFKCFLALTPTKPLDVSHVKVVSLRTMICSIMKYI